MIGKLFEAIGYFLIGTVMQRPAYVNAGMERKSALFLSPIPGHDPIRE
jgi:hypothetical protein